MESKIRESGFFQTPFIKIKAQVTMPGTTNGIPNIKDEYKYVVAPSAKKIATYIRNQLFGINQLTSNPSV